MLCAGVLLVRGRLDVNPTLAGLAITYLLTYPQSLAQLAQSFVELEHVVAR